VAEKELKKHLLETLVASQDRERELERLCDDVPSSDPERWTAKDHVAHLAHWRRYAAQFLAAVHAGSPPPNADDVDGVNAEVQAANRARPAVEVKEDARVSYAELGRAIEGCTDEELLRKREGRDGAVWEVVPPNVHLHLGEHLAFWHQALGDERAAEEGQMWMLAVHEAAFSEPKSRAFGAYNLGCFYAKLGRAADALPHLERSFELHPDLKTWARTDKDLDRIREVPELRAILE
jgi:tetratricopeptide (TPR) repeat protein